MLALSHRGHHLSCPENTLAAVAAARAAGADGVEVDVRRSADGRAVLFHDRIAPGGRPVAELTRDELATAAGYPVPTLDEALRQGEGLLWNVEIKTPAALAAAGEAIGDFAASRTILVSSFWHSLVPPLAALPGVEGGLILASRPLDGNGLAALAPPPAARVRTVVWYYEIFDEELLAQSTAVGLRSWVFGVATAAEHRRCSELAAAGLAAVITDRVDLLVGR
ncbi:MAG TPA: glycerophosphodiester phosphodiesterase [Thermoanaerobaculia bacterium]|jgi:glycerophosphoryl diester phosphodiesterase|nr:glycerophosphodiester phosphodiesterase [Thermoanaerobaculia bacterium]